MTVPDPRRSSVPAMTSELSPPDADFSPLQTTTIDLTQADVDWALQRVQAEGNSPAQWQDFLRSLALKGVHHWLAAGATDLRVSYPPDRVPPLGINCRVGDFRLCVIALGSLSDEQVPLPRATVEPAPTSAHLYVLAEVQEEVERVTILSGLRRDRLLALHQAGRLVQGEGTYLLPIQAFDSSPQDLLLYLTCLPPDRLATAISAPANPLTALGTDLINVGRWLQDQLGDVADRLAWTLLPPMTSLEPAPAFRSPTEEIERLLTEISPAVTIPPQARGAYVDCQSLGLPFRLYALTWGLLETDEPEWSLLLCLCPQVGSQLPPGTQLVIRDQATVLVEQTLEPATGGEDSAKYLYAQVIGNWDEQFIATIELPNGRSLTWPPFMFDPDL